MKIAGFIHDSRLSGTSQLGVRWKAGSFDEEVGWISVIAEPQFNGRDGSNHGNAPRLCLILPIASRVVAGLDPDGCRPSDLEVDSLVICAGEAVKNQISDPTFSIEPKCRTIDLGVFYFNNSTSSSGNCDRIGPTLGAGPYSGKYHQVTGARIKWAVPAAQSARIWRVLVLANDGRLDAWETENRLIAGAIDDGLDRGHDGLTNLEEFQRGTDLRNADSDGDGENDGQESEASSPRNPLATGDALTPAFLLSRSVSGPDLLATWPAAASPDNLLLRGYYHLYGSAGPTVFYKSNLTATADPDSNADHAPDNSGLPASLLIHTNGVANGGTLVYDCLTSIPVTAIVPLAPAVEFVTPGSGPASEGTRVTIFGQYLQASVTVSFGGGGSDRSCHSECQRDHPRDASPLRRAGHGDGDQWDGQSRVLADGFSFQ